MTTDQWIAVASIAAVVVAAIAIVAALKGVRDQLQVTVFLTYTDRYTKAMHDLSFEARRPGSEYRVAELPINERASVLRAYREYFNICSEEIWLHQRRRIDHATWAVWEKGMQQVARFPCFGEAWESLSFEYEYFDAFRDFVRDKLLPYAIASEDALSSVTHPADDQGSVANLEADLRSDSASSSSLPLRKRRRGSAGRRRRTPAAVSATPICEVVMVWLAYGFFGEAAVPSGPVAGEQECCADSSEAVRALPRLASPVLV